MTVENDGLPPTEAAAHAPDDTGRGPGSGALDPPTEALPLDAATATKVAADDAASRQAEAGMAGMAVTPPPPTGPLAPPVAGPAAPPPAGPAQTPPAARPSANPPAAPDQTTRVLPLDHRAKPPVPEDSTHPSHGSLEGDLFDGK